MYYTVKLMMLMSEYYFSEIRKKILLEVYVDSIC